VGYRAKRDRSLPRRHNFVILSGVARALCELRSRRTRHPAHAQHSARAVQPQHRVGYRAKCDHPRTYSASMPLYPQRASYRLLLTSRLM